MGRAALLLGFVWSIALASVVEAQSARPAREAADKKTCRVNLAAPSPAETKLNREEYRDAETLLRAELSNNPQNEAVHEALVRALIAQDKVTEAAGEAESWASAQAGNSMAKVALGDVRLRQGNVFEAFTQYEEAVHADFCNARAYYGLSRVDAVAGLHATARRLVEQAYALHPTDDQINGFWINTRPRNERLAKLSDYVAHSDEITDAQRANMKTSLEKSSLYRASDCKPSPTTPIDAKAPIVAVTDGPTRFLSWGLDVQFNGKRRRLVIDTGASGITLSHDAAAALGLQREDASEMGGIGDDRKVVKTSIAHVASVKVGGIELKNCPVEIVENWTSLDTDGLIGADVFADWVLTLDFPKHQLRIGPLPQPAEKKPAVSTAAREEDGSLEADDAYVAPEMSKWQPIYRVGHQLLISGGIVETKRANDEKSWKRVIFLMDTGSFDNMISPAAAKSVTKIASNSAMDVRGLSGKVDKVYEAGRFTLAFANLRLDSPSMTSLDLTRVSRSAGMEVSGMLGAPALFQVVLHIDYRDNLVWCEYKPF